MRVLLIDDDPAVRGSIRRVLDLAGYEVVAAADGPEGIQQFTSEKIDLVLLDLNLPSDRGWDVFERLTAESPLVPVVIITGMSNQYGTARAAGASALIEKPIEAPELLETLRQLLAEPKEAQLRRMCGYQDDTRYIRPGINPGGSNAAPEAARSHPRLRSWRSPHRRGR